MRNISILIMLLSLIYSAACLVPTQAEAQSYLKLGNNPQAVKSFTSFKPRDGQDGLTPKLAEQAVLAYSTKPQETLAAFHTWPKDALVAFAPLVQNVLDKRLASSSDLRNVGVLHYQILDIAGVRKYKEVLTGTIVKTRSLNPEGHPILGAMEPEYYDFLPDGGRRTRPIGFQPIHTIWNVGQECKGTRCDLVGIRAKLYMEDKYVVGKIEYPIPPKGKK